MAARVRLGDYVRLNQTGLEVIGGLKTPEQIEQHTRGSRVIYVSPEPVCFDPDGYDIELEGTFQPFLLTDCYVEII